MVGATNFNYNIYGVYVGDQLAFSPRCNNAIMPRAYNVT